MFTEPFQDAMRYLACLKALPANSEKRRRDYFRSMLANCYLYLTNEYRSLLVEIAEVLNVKTGSWEFGTEGAKT